MTTTTLPAKDTSHLDRTEIDDDGAGDWDESTEELAFDALRALDPLASEPFTAEEIRLIEAPLLDLAEQHAAALAALRQAHADAKLVTEARAGEANERGRLR